MSNRSFKTQLPLLTRRGRDNRGEHVERIAAESSELSSGDMINILHARGFHRIFPADRVVETPDGWSVKATKAELGLRGRD